MDDEERKAIYSRRIIERIDKQMAFEYGGIRSSDLTDKQKSTIFKRIGRKVEPLLVFWESGDKWTVLTVDHIFSLHSGRYEFCSLDDIQDEIEGLAPDGGLHNGRTLRTTDILFLRKPKIGVWAPAGEAFHSLWHILKYCRPINKRAKN